jgi:ABC-type uncharacterized transport system involved in gliding motility auxiliary subunit
MSKIGKTCLFIAALALIGGSIARLVYQQWDTSLYVPLVVFALCVGIAVISDHKFYGSFFAMRTTKHGMNMGTVILLVIVLLGAVNFISYQANKKWDLTDEKINSVSDQTRQTLKGLTGELKMSGFYTSGEDDKQKQAFLSIASMYKDESSKFSYEVVDPNKRPDLKSKFNVEAANTIVLQYNGKTRNVTETTEQTLTNAIVKLTHGASKIAYFLEGHGELDIDDATGPLGAGLYKQALIDATLEVKKFNLIQAGKIPTDAAMVLIVGPSQPLLDSEIETIVNYAKAGGGIMIAADPGKHHNIANLTKRLGVEFENKYIVDPVGLQLAQGPAFALGMEWSKRSTITKLFKDGTIAGFPLASPLKKSDSAATTEQFEDIVRTSPRSFASVNTPKDITPGPGETVGPQTVGIAVTGTLANAPAGKDPSTPNKEFFALIFGDSDFISNRAFGFQLNRDLAVNCASYLAKDTDLITIRPKELSKQALIMTSSNWFILLFTVLIPMPALFLLAGSVVWFRRRNA